jgi:hypothetical protein
MGERQTAFDRRFRKVTLLLLQEKQACSFQVTASIAGFMVPRKPIAFFS